MARNVRKLIIQDALDKTISSANRANRLYSSEGWTDETLAAHEENNRDWLRYTNIRDTAKKHN
jgi:hypothetical protein